MGGNDISSSICISFVPHSRHNHISTSSIFTGRMLFLMPNQQCQSTEVIYLSTMLYKSTFTLIYNARSTCLSYVCESSHPVTSWLHSTSSTSCRNSSSTDVSSTQCAHLHGTIPSLSPVSSLMIIITRQSQTADFAASATISWTQTNCSNYTIGQAWGKLKIRSKLPECFFWCRLTRVVQDKIQRAVKRLCVVCGPVVWKHGVIHKTGST